uniref:Uncharacterized protein n=1 Tax=Fundulus heteroclitus TaxID=8078 RepID=A0A3Q2QDK0_FUNHE
MMPFLTPCVAEKILSLVCARHIREVMLASTTHRVAKDFHTAHLGTFLTMQTVLCAKTWRTSKRSFWRRFVNVDIFMIWLKSSP